MPPTAIPSAPRVQFEAVARLPASGDNAAIAIRVLPAGLVVDLGDGTCELSDTILEGHRFAIRRIQKGERVLSWGLPFGLALTDVQPGDYLCNEKILCELRERQLEFPLPQRPNFTDYRLPYQLQEDSFHPGVQVQKADRLTFGGFRRRDGRGVGTRNFVVILGTSSRSAGFVQRVAETLRDAKADFPNVDGIVPVAHTEGGSKSTPNNREFVLRSLAGFMTNPNVGAVLCVDFGGEPINNEELKKFLRAGRYPVEGLLHDFLSIGNGWPAAASSAEKLVREWLPRVNACVRTAEPVSELKLALQCGGSDAFSGVSANPLLGILSREIVARGGSANLAETSELIGAESYVLKNVRDLATAEKFLRVADRFQEWAGWHGHSAEGNPSGGNMLRGLYNISIKSIGAGLKKDPAVRLDYVIDYAEPMRDAGFYFMDSPGNDLESIAGQVASGCNMILFATGNGSITNFPFVPTIKVMTTTGRFELVRNEMDFNAGRYLDGEPLESLGIEALEQMLAIASGQRSRGELAGHAQVQLWREWRRKKASEEIAAEAAREPVKTRSSPLQVAVPPELEGLGSVSAASRQVGLVLPTSLCSGQIALLIAEKATRALKNEDKIRKVVALPHTEGCGNSRGASEELFTRTLANYLAHPYVNTALLLEHGCEKTHNDAFHHVLRDLKIPMEDVGWASIQLDGGIDKVTGRVLEWFETRAGTAHRPSGLTVGFWGENIPDDTRQALKLVWDWIINSGGSVVVGENSWKGEPGPTLLYGARFSQPGLHVMESPTDDPAEILTGLGATGATILLAYSSDQIIPAHPLIPVLQFCTEGQGKEGGERDFLLPPKDPEAQALVIAQGIARTLRDEEPTRAEQLGNIAFQITRGFTGISL